MKRRRDAKNLEGRLKLAGGLAEPECAGAAIPGAGRHVRARARGALLSDE